MLSWPYLSWSQKLLRLALFGRCRPIHSRVPRAPYGFAPLVEALESRFLPSVSLNFREFHDPSRIPAGRQPSAMGILPQDNGFQFPIGYVPSDIRTAYGIDQVMFGSVVGDGTGQTIAIVDAYDDPAFLNSTDPLFSTSDLAQFDSQLGVPDPPSFIKLNQYGQTSPLPPTDPAGAGNPNGNWEIEEALDVEWAHGIAPGANIILVEAKSDSDDDLFGAVAMAAGLPGVSAVSMSWGENEFSTEAATRDDTFVTPSGHQGVTFLAASGDTGGFAVDSQGNPTTTPGIDYPAASPNVVAVGGTNLQLNADSTYHSETAWTGSGGGTSLYENEPSWQQNVQQTGFRTTPDVAFDADPYSGVAIYDSYNDKDNSGPWIQIGGTSLAAPAWAGLIAIANQGRVLAGGSTLDGAGQTLPALYSFTPNDFNDITIGTNGVFDAGPGYDEVTGLGTPVAVPLITDLSMYGSANHLGVTAQPPSSVIVGDKFGVVVAAENQVGGIDPAFNGTLTIALASGPAGATLGGNLTVTAVNGIAVFDGLTLDTLGSGYTLQITSTTFPTITTNSFTVISDPTPWQGTFYPVPTDASLRAAINAADSNGFAFNTLLLSASTYLLTNKSAGGVVIENTSSLPEKTLTVAGQGQASTVIGSTYFWHARIFEIVGSAASGVAALSVAMDDLTIQGGDARDGGILGGNDALGGGLLIDNATVTLTNVAVKRNEAEGAHGAVGAAGGVGVAGGAGGNGNNGAGGGIYLAGGTLTLVNDTFSGNDALGGIGGTGGAGGGQGTKNAAAMNPGAGGAGGSGGSAAGGAIYARGGTIIAENNSFQTNQALGGVGGAGGAGGSGGHGQGGPGKTGGLGGAGGPGRPAYGGGIYLAGGALTLTGGTLQNNSVVGGAGGQGGTGGPGTMAGTTLGIFGGGGSTFNFGGLTGPVFIGGPGGDGGPGGLGAAGSGGGVYVAAGSLTLVNTTLAGNLAIGGAGGTGGRGGTGGFGSQVTSFLLLPTGRMGGTGGAGGHAGNGNGGGLMVAAGNVLLYADTLNANRATGGKGGAGGTGGYGPLAALGSGSFGITTGGTGGFGTPTGGGGSVLASGGPGGNGGDGGTGQGGGFYLSGGALTLCNATDAGNNADAGAAGDGGDGGKMGTGKATGGKGTAGSPGDSYGGGLFVSGGVLTLDNSTIALNSQSGTGYGGGAVAQSPGAVTAVSTLFGGNGTVDFSGNVTATDSLFQTRPINGTVSGSGNLIGVNPLLNANGLQNNGGPTQTIALQASSPAIDVGTNSQNLFADQRGYGPRSGPGGTDIGAFQTSAQADTQAPTATLNAPAVTDSNAAALNPYTFTITFADNVAIAVATLSSAVVQVLPPGLAAPITATVESILAVGPTDDVGNAQTFVVTYVITPPGGAWTGADDGTYTVVLGGGSVTDLAGNPVASGALGTFSVQVSGQSYSVVITKMTPPSATEQQTTGTYAVATFTDNNPNALNNVTATVVWGDGHSDTLSAANGGIVQNADGSFSVVDGYTYAEEASGLTFSVQVVDSNAGSDQESATINVADATLTDTSSTVSASGTEGLATGSIIVATFTDGNPGDNSAEMSATIHWGDGSSSAGTVSYASGSYTVTGSTTYAEEGNYATWVNVVDVGGSKLTGIGKTTVSVADAALTDTSSTVSASDTEGLATGTIVVATFTDADPGNNSGDFTATIHWGNGTNSTGTISYSGGTYTVTGSASYVEEGTYAVTVDVMDIGGSKLTAIGKTTVTVADAALTVTSFNPPTGAVAGVNTGTLTVATFTDANTTRDISDFTAVVAWGDGSTDTLTGANGGILPNPDGSFHVVASHTYPRALFNATFSVTVTDVGGSTVSESALISVELNVIGQRITATENASVQQVTVATFTDANVTTYTATVDWGDNDTSASVVVVKDAKVSGQFDVVATKSHPYAEGGSYSTGATVQAANGTSGYGTGAAAVADLAITASPAALPRTTEGSTLNTRVATFKDADTSEPINSYTATIDWGDGHTSSGTVQATATRGSYVVLGTHVYAEEGTYKVTVSIADTGGATAAATERAAVADAALTPAGKTLSATEGNAFSGTVATFRDAYAAAPVGDFTATITWGDSHTSSGTVVSNGNGQFSVLGSHTYAEKHSYAVSVKIADVGGSTTTASSTVAVADAPLSGAGVPITPVHQVPFIGLVASFADGNPNAPLGDFTATITWGDGGRSKGTVTVNPNGGFDVLANHTYANAGIFTITILIADLDGATLKLNTTATVS
jgi:hypothetical protein